jgi:hypothetical protein
LTIIFDCNKHRKILKIFYALTNGKLKTNQTSQRY